MTKQEQFLYIVQMTTLANNINLSTQKKETIAKYQHVISATGVFHVAQEALRVSEQIPEEISASEAANDFVTYFLDNQKDMEETNLKCPSWCL